MGHHLLRMTNACPATAYPLVRLPHRMQQLYGPLLRVLLATLFKTLHLFFKALKCCTFSPFVHKMMHVGALWTCLCKAHSGGTRYKNSHSWLLVSHSVGCSLFTGFVWQHTRDIFHALSVQYMWSLLSICWMEIYVKNIIYTYRKRTHRYVHVVISMLYTCNNTSE